MLGSEENRGTIPTPDQPQESASYVTDEEARERSRLLLDRYTGINTTAESVEPRQRKQFESSQHTELSHLDIRLATETSDPISGDVAAATIQSERAGDSVLEGNNYTIETGPVKEGDVMILRKWEGTRQPLLSIYVLDGDNHWNCTTTVPVLAAERELRIANKPWTTFDKIGEVQVSTVRPELATLGLELAKLDGEYSVVPAVLETCVEEGSVGGNRYVLAPEGRELKPNEVVPVRERRIGGDQHRFDYILYYGIDEADPTKLTYKGELDFDQLSDTDRKKVYQTMLSHEAHVSTLMEQKAENERLLLSLEAEAKGKSGAWRAITLEPIKMKLNTIQGDLAILAERQRLYMLSEQHNNHASAQPAEKEVATKSENIPTGTNLEIWSQLSAMNTNEIVAVIQKLRANPDQNDKGALELAIASLNLKDIQEVIKSDVTDAELVQAAIKMRNFLHTLRESGAPDWQTQADKAKAVIAAISLNKIAIPTIKSYFETDPDNAQLFLKKFQDERDNWKKGNESLPKSQQRDPTDAELTAIANTILEDMT